MIAISIDMNKVVMKLKDKRFIFHSEADFQFALAWEIQREYPLADVRLEYAYKIGDKTYHIDILVILEGRHFPIELKYKTLKKSIQVDDEEFHLKNHGAQDIGKYDLIKDIVRIENILASDDQFTTGFAIMLSNDPSYWNESTRKDTCCAAFNISDGKVVRGTLTWAEHTGVGTMKNREEPLELTGSYSINWHNYSQSDHQRNGQFKYLLIEVDK